jgi:hypothetical protein
MLLVLASARDAAARELVASWRAAGEEVGLATTADLSVKGWRHIAGDPEAGRAVVAGDLVPTGALRAVVCRLAGVDPGELERFHADDRLYAAAEMQAFLLGWLSSLPCPVLNRPRPGHMAGPLLAPEEWAARARRLGIPARARTRRSAFPAGGAAPDGRADLLVVEVVGARAFVEGEACDAAGPARMAAALAADAGAELLRVGFCHGALESADPFVDVSRPAIADALLARCLGRPRLRRVAVA